jgi:hypothetical protein
MTVQTVPPDNPQSLLCRVEVTKVVDAMLREDGIYPLYGERIAAMIYESPRIAHEQGLTETIKRERGSYLVTLTLPEPEKDLSYFIGLKEKKPAYLIGFQEDGTECNLILAKKMNEKQKRISPISRFGLKGYKSRKLQHCTCRGEFEGWDIENTPDDETTIK